jgi:hypothetical protein
MVLELQRNLCIEVGMPIVSSQRAAYTFRKIFFHTSKPKSRALTKFNVIMPCSESQMFLFNLT